MRRLFDRIPSFYPTKPAPRPPSVSTEGSNASPPLCFSHIQAGTALFCLLPTQASRSPSASLPLLWTSLSPDLGPSPRETSLATPRDLVLPRWGPPPLHGLLARRPRGPRSVPTFHRISPPADLAASREATSSSSWLLVHPRYRPSPLRRYSRSPSLGLAFGLGGLDLPMDRLVLGLCGPLVD